MPIASSNSRKIWFILLLSVCCSCYNTRQEKMFETLKQLDASLRASNDYLNENNNSIMTSFDYDLEDMRTHEKAIVLQPQAKNAYDLSKNLILYIDNLKLSLKKEAGLTNILPE